MTWIDNSDDESSFVIKRSTDGAPFEELGTAEAGQTSFLDTSPQADALYTYFVLARDIPLAAVFIVPIRYFHDY